MATYAFTAAGTRHAEASVCIELYDWILGTTYLGPAYDLPVVGGGQPNFTGLRDHTIRLGGGGGPALIGHNVDHHLALTTGPRASLEGQAVGDLYLTGRLNAHASTAIEINQIEMGISPMGPLPFGLSGGGALLGAGDQIGGQGGAFTVDGGGDLTLAATRNAKAFLLQLSGGGATAGLGSIYRALAVNCFDLIVEPGVITLGPAPAPQPADLLLTLSTTELPLAPGALEAIVGNGTPGGIATFEIVDGGSDVEVLIARFDDSGFLPGISVPIEVTAEGTYGLRVTDVTQSLTATATFTVDAVADNVTIGVPVTTPPPAVQPVVGVKKWVFQDPATSDEYHFAVNPNKMDSPHAPKRITFTATTAVTGNRLAFEGQASPVEWKFSGVLFDKAQYDAFVYWLGKRNRIWVTDHWGRAWLVYLTAFSPEPRRDVNHAWCHDYTVTAIIFEGPVTPA